MTIYDEFSTWIYRQTGLKLYDFRVLDDDGTSEEWVKKTVRQLEENRKAGRDSESCQSCGRRRIFCLKGVSASSCRRAIGGMHGH